jgi:RNA polymerase sigma-70 factor, ECF subfamily
VARETYVGLWLPEPVLSDAEPDPEASAELAESLSIAFLVLLESLSPLERAVFLLRDVFGFEYEEISQMVDRSSAACRQLAARARRHLQEGRSRSRADRPRGQELANRFLAACASGDLAGLMPLLTDDVVVVADGGGKARAAARSIAGRRNVAAYMVGIARMVSYISRVLPAAINGQPGFVLFDQDRLDSVLALDVAPEGVRAVHIIVNPDKLGWIARQVGRSGPEG